MLLPDFPSSFITKAVGSCSIRLACPSSPHPLTPRLATHALRQRTSPFFATFPFAFGKRKRQVPHWTIKLGGGRRRGHSAGRGGSSLADALVVVVVVVINTKGMVGHCLVLIAAHE